MIEAALKEIQKYYGANRVLKRVSFEIQTGERVGLIGRNGTGKTTVFKIISGMEKADGGSLMLRKGITAGYLEQIPEYPEDYTVMDVMNTAFEGLSEIKDRLVKLEKMMVDAAAAETGEIEGLLKRYGEVQQLFEQRGGYEMEEKLGKVCTGLKISGSLLERKFRALSGGEKTTVLLGKILLQNPDLLLLDEPTNHLDMEAIEWLEECLAEYEGTVLVISHDRYFLDKVVQRMVEIRDGEAEIYEGNFSYYVEEKERRLLERLEAYNQQQKKIKQLEKAAHDLREWGKIADNPAMFKRAVNIERRIERMDKVERPSTKKSVMRLSFEENGTCGKDVIRVSGIAKAYGDNSVLRKADLHIRNGEKAVILGKNGTGKTTLIKIVLGMLTPDEGEVKLGPGVKESYLEQNVSFENEENTVLEEFRESLYISEGEARRILAGFLFRGEDVFKKVKSLSGGEKSRLRLCQLMQQDVNLLVLDEPTNHLDIESREVLEKVLGEFEGTILFISHDRYFINCLAGRVIELREGSLYSYLGNYDDYKEKKLQQKQNAQPEIVRETRKPEVRPNRMENCEAESKRRQKKLEDLEEQIGQTEWEIKEKASEMEKQAVNYEKLQELHSEKQELESRLERLMEEWMEAE